MNDNFAIVLKNAIKNYQSNSLNNNWDFRRFGPCPIPSVSSSIKNFAKAIVKSLGLSNNKQLKAIKRNISDLQWIYGRLIDAESKQLLISIMAYRVLGCRHVKLPLNTSEYWEKLSALEQGVDKSLSIDSAIKDRKLDLYDLRDEEYPIKAYATAMGIYTQLVLQQYRCQTINHVIEVCEGDTVIDAGGCYGDTALYFAHKAGEMGKVFSFEFMPDNINIFKKNLELNPSLASRISIVPNPLWSSSGRSLYIEGFGAGTHVTPIPKDLSAKQIKTLCIDDLLQNKQLNKVDFIKMDIEGAELEALKGAETCIRNFKPKLAISVYHNLHDFWIIPQWIESLNLDYRFSLRHFTIHAEETVLFAEVI